METDDVITTLIGHMDERFGTIERRFDRVDEKFDAQTKRMDALIDTTNHRLDDFHTEMEASKKDVNEELGKKANTTELLTSIGFQLGNNDAFRWLIGVVFAAVVGTALVQHWWGNVLHLVGF